MSTRSIILGLMAVSSATANAQRVPDYGPPSPGASDLKEGVRAGSKDTRRVVQDFARCITRLRFSILPRYLDSSATKLPSALRSTASECLGEMAGDGSMIRGQGDTFRYALAEAYVVRKFRVSGIGDIAAIAPLAKLGSVEHPHDLGVLGECIIRKSPKDSWGLLQTVAASEQESARFKALAPSMQSCVTQNTTVKMPAFFLRGAIAETYYRLSKAPLVSAGATR